MNIIASPKGWIESSLEKIAKIERETVQPEKIKTGTVYLGLEHITSEGYFTGAKSVEAGELASNKFVFSNRHLLYGKLRPYLKKIARPNFNGICSTDILPILPNVEVDRDYLYHYLRQPSFIELATARSTGANLPRLSPKDLADFPVVFPPIAEQRRIAAILDRADAVRRKRKEAIALTEELLRSAFLEMFGDPSSNPKGWKIVSIESVAAPAKNALAIGPFGSSLKVNDYRESGHPVVFVRDVRVNQFNWISQVFVDDKKFQELQSHHIRPDDVVATKMGLPPCIATVYPKSMPIGVVTADIIKVTLDRNKVTPTYAAAVINSDFCKGQVARFTEGITRPKVTLRDFKRLLIPCPPLNYQEKWETFSCYQQKTVARLSSDLDNLNNLFNSLLQRAFRGEL